MIWNQIRILTSLWAQKRKASADPSEGNEAAWALHLFNRLQGSCSRRLIRWREALTIHTGEGLKVVDEFKITSAKPIEEGRSIT